MKRYIGFCVFSLSGYIYLGDGGTDRREILHDGRLHIGPGHKVSSFGEVFSKDTQNPKFWAYISAI